MLPESVEQIVNAGDTAPASVINNLQTSVVRLHQEVNQRVVFVPIEAHNRVVSGTVSYSNAGVLQSTTSVTVNQPMALNDHDTVSQVRVRLADNGTNVWTCALRTVDLDGVRTLIDTQVSSGGGAYEWVTFPSLSFTGGPGVSMFVEYANTNGAGTQVRIRGMEVSFSS